MLTAVVIAIHVAVSALLMLVGAFLVVNERAARES